jgi:hypothetical protein
MKVESVIACSPEAHGIEPLAVGLSGQAQSLALWLPEPHHRRLQTEAALISEEEFAASLLLNAPQLCKGSLRCSPLLRGRLLR